MSNCAFLHICERVMYVYISPLFLLSGRASTIKYASACQFVNEWYWNFLQLSVDKKIGCAIEYVYFYGFSFSSLSLMSRRRSDFIVSLRKFLWSLWSDMAAKVAGEMVYEHEIMR